MAKKSTINQTDSGTLQSEAISDRVVSQVGKAAVEVASLRQSLEAGMARAQTDAERQTLTDQAEVSAIRAISEHGLTVAEFNEVIEAAQSDPELEQRVLLACKTV